MDKRIFSVAWLRGNPLFADLPEAVIENLADHCTIRSFNAGELLIRENGDNDTLFLLTRGEVRILCNGTEVDRQSAGDTVGEISTANISPPVADVIAIDDVEAVALPLELVRHLCSEQPGFAARLRETGMRKVYGR